MEEVKELKQTVKALLYDINLPDEYRAKALEKICSSWLSSKKGVLENIWKTLGSKSMDKFLLKGPNFKKLKYPIRVSRVLDVDTFLYYYLGFPLMKRARANTLRMLKTRIPNYMQDIIIERVQSIGRYVWATLSKELINLSPDEIADSLALHWYSKDKKLMIVEYDIDPIELFVPTVLDAAMNPSFVPHVNAENDLPRTWNWVKQKWALPEFIHSPKANIKKISIRILGRITSPRNRLPFLRCLEPIRSLEIEKLIARILRQIIAHRNLEPFLLGNKTIFNLTWREFELFLGDLFRRTGLKVHVTKPTRDRGFDLIAISDEESSKGLLIEAKKTEKKVGIGIIRELAGARFFAGEGFENFIMVVATTGSFSWVARKVRYEHVGELKLIDYNDLQKQLKVLSKSGIRDIVQDAIESSRHGLQSPQ